MYVDLTREDRAWIAEQLRKRVPGNLKDDPQFVAAIGRYIETGNATGFLWERFGKVIDYLQKSLIYGNIHDEQGRESFIEHNAYAFIEANGGEYLRQFHRELAAAYPDPSRVTEAEKNAFAYAYSQREAHNYMASDEGKERMAHMMTYWQQHGMPPMDNPRALRRYVEGYVRTGYPDADAARHAELVELTMGMFNEVRQDERRQARREKRQGCAAIGLLGVFVLSPLIVMGVFYAALLGLVALYTIDHPLINAVNLAIFSAVLSLSLFFYVRRKLTTPGERLSLVLSALLMVAIFAGMWFSGVLDLEFNEVTLRQEPEYAVLAMLAIFGVLSGSALWLKRNVFRLLLAIAVVGALVIAAAVAWQQGGFSLTSP